MAKIAEQAENDAFDIATFRGIKYDMDAKDTTNAVCDAACTTAKDIDAAAIIALTKYGQTARRMSKFRPDVPIVAATPVEKTFHQLSLSWGVYPVIARYQNTTDQLFVHAVDCAKQIDLVSDGDRGGGRCGNSSRHSRQHQHFKGRARGKSVEVGIRQSAAKKHFINRENKMYTSISIGRERNGILYGRASHPRR